MGNEFEMTEVVKEAPNSLVQIEQSRAVQEVQAALIIAKKFPRDEHDCYTRIMKSCERYGLAEQAIYKLPIGGKIQEGPSIHLSKAVAQIWGNISFGINEVERANGVSKCEAFCWDQQSNTRSTSRFDVEHWREVGVGKANKSRQPITDPVEIKRHISNIGARDLRNCILNVIPADVIDDAMKTSKATVIRGPKGVTHEERIRLVLVNFDKFQVTQEMLEKHLGHPIATITSEEIASLTTIYKSLADKQAKRSDYFPLDTDRDPDKEKEKVLDVLKQPVADEDLAPVF